MRYGRVQLQRTLLVVGGSNCGRAGGSMRTTKSKSEEKGGGLSRYALLCLFCEGNEDDGEQDGVERLQLRPTLLSAGCLYRIPQPTATLPQSLSTRCYP
jgi:hypothetical protein